MQYREIGTSGIQASVVAVGAWAMGGWMWGGTNKDESIKAIHAALDGGVNFIDTAPIYGFGLSEEIVGEAIRGRRDKVVVATKCGMVCSPDVGEYKFSATAQGIDPDGHIPVSIYQGRDSIRKEVESSLRRLNTDYIDVLQTHWQDATTPISETMETLLELKREGKIRAIGACNADTAQLSEYLEIGQLDSDQEKYSMLDRGMEQSQAPYCRERGISIFAYSPLANGLLTGNMSPDRKFAPGDLRADRPRFSVENRRAVLDMLTELQPIAEEKHISLVQLVTAWTVAGNGATHALCGMRNPAQAQENAPAGAITFEESEMSRMNAVLAKYAEIIS